MDAKPIKNLRIISEKDMKLTQKNCEIDLGRSDPQTHGDTERMIARSATTPSSSFFSLFTN